MILINILVVRNSATFHDDVIVGLSVVQAVHGCRQRGAEARRCAGSERRQGKSRAIGVVQGQFCRSRHTKRFYSRARNQQSSCCCFGALIQVHTMIHRGELSRLRSTSKVGWIYDCDWVATSATCRLLQMGNVLPCVIKSQVVSRTSRSPFCD